MRVIFVSAVVSLILPFASVARGQEESTDESLEMNARRLFEAGRAAFNENRYQDALDYFQQTYEMSPRPRLLYNIGVSAEHTGARERAIEALEQYLHDEPDAENRSEVEARLTVLRRQRDEGAASSSTASGPGPEGWILFGASLAVVAGGAVMIGVAASDYATVEGLPDGGTWASVADAAGRAPVLLGVGIVCAAVGAAGAISGVVLATSGSGGGATRVSLGFGSLSIRGAF